MKITVGFGDSSAEEVMAVKDEKDLGRVSEVVGFVNYVQGKVPHNLSLR